MNWSAFWLSAGLALSLVRYAGLAAWWFDFTIRRNYHGVVALGGFLLWLSVLVGFLAGTMT